MTENLSELKIKCQELGLTVVQTGKRESKVDYVDVLRNYYLIRDYGCGHLPYEEIEPMKCFAIWNLKEEEEKEIWQDGNGWVAQEKLNGCRMILHFVKGVGVFAHSRTVSEQTYRYTELTETLLFHEFVPAFEAIVDCEAIVDKPIDTSKYTDGKGGETKSSLHSTSAIFHLRPENARKLQEEQNAPLILKTFDIIRWNGRDLQAQPLSKRLDYLQDFKVVIANTEIGKFFEFPTYQSVDKKSYFEFLVSAGGEGVVLKNLESVYVATSSRPRDAWVKVKKRQDYDAFVIGFERGKVGSAWRNLVGDLWFGVYTESGKIHHLGCASNLTMDFRQEITIYDQEKDEVTLKPSLMGKVAQISGQDISPRSFRLSHCTLDRWRDKIGDIKNMDECVVSLADLKKAAEWVS